MTNLMCETVSDSECGLIHSDLLALGHSNPPHARWPPLLSPPLLACSHPYSPPPTRWTGVAAVQVVHTGDENSPAVMAGPPRGGAPASHNPRSSLHSNAIMTHPITDVLDGTLWNRQLGGVSEDIVASLARQLFAGIRDYLVQAVEMKFNCFFLMPVIDAFPVRLREELEAAYEADLDAVFDVAAVRPLPPCCTLCAVGEAWATDPQPGRSALSMWCLRLLSAVKTRDCREYVRLCGLPSGWPVAGSSGLCSGWARRGCRVMWCWWLSYERLCPPWLY